MLGGENRILEALDGLESFRGITPTYLVVDDLRRFKTSISARNELEFKADVPLSGPTVSRTACFHGVEVRENSCMLPGTYAFTDAAGNPLSMGRYV